MIAGEEKPAVAPVFTFPVVDPAIRDDDGVRIARVGPDLFPCGGIERDDRIVPSQDVG